MITLLNYDDSVPYKYIWARLGHLWKFILIITMKREEDRTMSAFLELAYFHSFIPMSPFWPFWFGHLLSTGRRLQDAKAEELPVGIRLPKYTSCSLVLQLTPFWYESLKQKIIIWKPNKWCPVARSSTGPCGIKNVPIFELFMFFTLPMSCTTFWFLS